MKDKRDLEEFMKNVKMINKDLSEYEDEKGFYYVLGTAQLLCGVEYMELEEPQYKQAIFNQEIDKNIEYKKTTVKKTKVKSDITGKEEDNTTIIDADVEAYQVWAVRNQLKINKSFNDREEAIKYAKEINSKVYEMLGI